MSVDWTKLIRETLLVRPPLELPRRLKLPVLPQAVVEFTSIAENPEAGPQELAPPIEADSALTSESKAWPSCRRNDAGARPCVTAPSGVGASLPEGPLEGTLGKVVGDANGGSAQ